VKVRHSICKNNNELYDYFYALFLEKEYEIVKERIHLNLLKIIFLSRSDFYGFCLIKDFFSVSKNMALNFFLQNKNISIIAQIGFLEEYREFSWRSLMIKGIPLV